MRSGWSGDVCARAVEQDERIDHPEYHVIQLVVSDKRRAGVINAAATPGMALVAYLLKLHHI